MMITDRNIDPAETTRFSALADNWWDPDGPLSTLHDINPIRLGYIQQRVDLSGNSVLDVGCGGGILTESMARAYATVCGIDASHEAIKVARHHCQSSGLEITYEQTTAESFAEQHPQAFDVITCMEMMEHVPDPLSIIGACSRMLKPGGNLVLSTINRNLKAYLASIIVAEYMLRLLPAGTHDYARFIRPSELALWCEQSGLVVRDISGMSYLPFLHMTWLKGTPDVNYLLHATK